MGFAVSEDELASLAGPMRERPYPDSLARCFRRSAFYGTRRRHNRGERADRSALAEIEAGTVAVVRIPHTFEGGRIDWSFNATGGDSGLPLDNEWQWQLNRMEWWPELCEIHRATGDERAARVWAAQLRSWIEQCPPPIEVDNRPGSSWRTIECGERMSVSWLDAYLTFRDTPGVSDQDLIMFARSALTQARYLAACSTRLNWLTIEMNGLYSIGVLFPDFPEATRWRRQALDALHEQLETQFLPDGAQLELTPWYHNVALENIVSVYDKALAAGYEHEIPPGLVQRLEQVYAYDLDLSAPDRTVPRLNDSGRLDVTKTLEHAASLFPHRTDMAYVAADGQAGQSPRETSHAFPYAGYFAMRDGWSREANMCLVDAGPVGAGHVHQDMLSVTAWAYGRELLFDSGGGSYEHSEFRRYGISSHSHNTVIVDGLSQHRERSLPRARTEAADTWQSTPLFDFVCGTYRDAYGEAGHHPAVHRRSVLFVKPAASLHPFWIVDDLLKPADDDAHDYEARWHLLTTRTTSGVCQMITTADPGRPNLAVVPLTPQGLEVRSTSGQQQPELLGWDLPKDRLPRHVPATTIQHRRRAAGVVGFRTLLLPVPDDRSLLSAVEPNDVEPGAFARRTRVDLTDGSGFLVGDASGRIRVSLRAADGTYAPPLGPGVEER